MSGEKDLQNLLSGMNPQINPGEYVFCCVNKIPENINTLMIFQEQEGYTLILKKSDADEYHLKYDSIMGWITLHIHSSLDAVGLTAAFSSELGKHNMSCNVVAGFYHDHIFVNKKDLKQAEKVLIQLTNS